MKFKPVHRPRMIASPIKTRVNMKNRKAISRTSTVLPVKSSNSRVAEQTRKRLTSFKLQLCPTDDRKLELPFQDRTSISVGNTLVHLIKCSTKWEHKHVRGDNCEICKAERKAIIEEVKQRVAERFKETLRLTEEKEKEEAKPLALEEQGQQQQDNSIPAPVEDSNQSQPVKEESTSSSSDTKLHMRNRNDTRFKSRNISGRGRSRSKQARGSPSATNIGKKKQGLAIPRRNVNGSIFDSFLSTKSSIFSISSHDSLNGKMISYAEWDKIKEQTLEALYDPNPDIEKLYSMYVQIRKVRLTSPEMSNTCNEAQALLDNTVSQLYVTMTDPCRENITLNKIQDTDMLTLTALIQATQVLKQQLNNFNIFDRDGVVKRAELKIRERIKKTIAVAARSKNRDQLTELIIIMKNNPFLKSNELLETARRQVQGLTYDDFITKHSNRLKHTGAPSKKSMKDGGQLRTKLNKLIAEIEQLQGDGTVDVELNSALLIQLIEILEEHLKKLGDVYSPEFSGGIDLYFRIVRGAIRRTVQSKESGEDITKLRKVLKTRGRALPLRMKTLEICQLIDKFRVTRNLLERNRHTGDQMSNKTHLQSLQEVTQNLVMMLKDPKVSKIIPEKLKETLQNQANQFMKRNRYKSDVTEFMH